jgi:hypothetical protein
VRTALGQKVSKERVGTELEGMFNGECWLPPDEEHNTRVDAVVTQAINKLMLFVTVQA